MGERDRNKFRIVLTGATGFIGFHLQRELLANGHELVALVRPRSKRSDRLLPNVAVCRAELDDREKLATVLAGADLVIHCAGSVRGRRAADFEYANIEGVRHLTASATHAMRAPRMLLVSSLAASRPELSDYAHSKHAGESIVRGTAGLDWVIVRPPAVYGPGDREMRPLFQSIRRGLAVLVGPRDQRLSLLYVADLARAVGAIVACFGDCSRQVFELDDGVTHGYDWPDIIAAARGSMPVVRLRVPRALLAGLATVNLRLAALFGYAPMLTPGKVRELSQSTWLCNNHSLTALTGWAPRVRLRDGVNATFAATER